MKKSHVKRAGQAISCLIGFHSDPCEKCPAGRQRFQSEAADTFNAKAALLNWDSAKSDLHNWWRAVDGSPRCQCAPCIRTGLRELCADLYGWTYAELVDADPEPGEGPLSTTAWSEFYMARAERMNALVAA